MLFGTLACHLRYALLIMITVVVIILFSKWTGSGGTPSLPFYKPSLQATPSAALLKEAREYNDAPAPNSVVGLMQTTHALALVHAAAADNAPFAAELKNKQRQYIAHIASTYPEVLQT